jgi:hypothetical protein
MAHDHLHLFPADHFIVHNQDFHSALLCLDAQSQGL